MEGSSLSSESKLSWTGLEELNFDSVQMQLPEVSIHPVLAVACLFALFYILYYLSCVVNKPKVTGGQGGLKGYLLKHCPCLSRRYWPKFWAFQCHLSTVLRAVMQKCPSDAVKYMREIVTLKDGGEVALDWADVTSDSSLSSDNRSSVEESMPMLLILPGITGSSSDNYIMHLVQDGVLSGYRPVVFNQRGNGGLYLKTVRTYSASDISDLSEVVQTIHKHYPKAPVVGLGVSLGGMILTQYLHQLGKECDLSAVIAISVAWDPFITKKSLEERLDNRVLYSRFMTSRLREMVQRNTKHFSPKQLKELPFCVDKVMTCSTVSEFDYHLTVPLFGYSSVDEYYKASRNSDKLHKICRPFICLTAADDPFVPKNSVPVKEFESNPHTLLVMTTHGGHFGFLEGLRPGINVTWMNRICRQLLVALKSYE